MLEIREYVTERGRSPFGEWFGGLNAPAAAKIATTLVRMEHGNLSNAKSVGEGVHEYRIDFGPGYRVYFGRFGESLIVLLGGGTKRRQHRDIEAAQMLWKEFRRRRRREN